MTLKINNLSIQKNAHLSEFTTFRLGGPCRGLISCQTPNQLEEAIEHLVKEHFDFILIGGGSNLVVSDEGIDCYVIRYVSKSPIIQKNQNDLIISGSTYLDHLATYAIEHSLEGINFASGIPGTVGGAVVGNAGAFGKQIGDIVERVTILTKKGVKKDLLAKDLNFQYRDSRLKETGDIIVSVKLNLNAGNKDQLQKERNEILSIRQEKHPNLEIHPCAGSFFRNIEPTSKADKRQAAGFFLEEAGGKQLSCGGAKIFEKHANIIVKSTNCTAQDVFNLSQLMIDAVEHKFNFKLIREVRFVGSFKGMPSNIQSHLW